jgi:hypothetical protein
MNRADGIFYSVNLTGAVKRLYWMTMLSMSLGIGLGKRSIIPTLNMFKNS